MFQHHEGHEGSQHPNALLDGTLDIVWVVYEGSERPGARNLLTTFETGTQGLSGFGESLGSCYGQSKSLH